MSMILFSILDNVEQCCGTEHNAGTIKKMAITREGTVQVIAV